MTRKPIRRFLPLTYTPKIPGVLEGKITQSIRIDTDLKMGDFIAFHGWQGRPYHSHWSFRTPFMSVRHAEQITVRKDSIYFVKEKVAVKACDLNYLAALDGIEPATGEELIRILHEMHGKGALHGKIIRWDPAPILETKIQDKESLLTSPKLNTIIETPTAELVNQFRSPQPSKDFVQLGAFDKQVVQ